jgi:NitT/TauT family transport system ATP-binding protein
MSQGMEVRFSQVAHAFPGRPPRPALDEINLTIPPAQFAAVVGPSGCGKSTLLRLAAGLLTPSGGTITVDGVSPAQAAAGQRLAWMAQSPALLPWRSARANVDLVQQFLPAGAARMTADEALERVGLADAAHAYPFMLSGGMQQRVALARTLSLPADAWLMDEPFAALDELTRERLTAELMELWLPRRPTVLWVTHNLSEALRLADRVVVLTDRPARIAADLPVALPRPRDDSSAEFIALLKELRKALSDG